MTETLSSRGRRATSPALSYFNLFFEGMEKGLYSTTNLDGYVLLAVAENRLLYESVALPRFNSSKVRKQIGNDAGAYSSMTGRKSLKNAWAEFMTRTVLKKYNVDSTNLIIGSGVGSLISNLAFLLCEPGDGILLPVPAYGALFNDFKVVAEAVVVDVICEAPLYRITEEALNKSLERALHNGTIVRILFIVNPNNPFGFVYSKEELLFLIQWATENTLIAKGSDVNASDEDGYTALMVTIIVPQPNYSVFQDLLSCGTGKSTFWLPNVNTSLEEEEEEVAAAA